MRYAPLDFRTKNFAFTGATVQKKLQAQTETRYVFRNVTPDNIVTLAPTDV